MKRKLWYGLCVGMLLASLTACEGEKDSSGGESGSIKDAVVSKTEGNEQDKEETDTEKSDTEKTDQGNSEEKQQTPEEKFADREKAGSTLISVYYPENWTYMEEETDDEDNYCSMEFYVGTSVDDAEFDVVISASSEKASGFREELLNRGIMLEDYADGSALTAKIGDMTYAPVGEDGSSYLGYIYRDEQSGTTYKIRVLKGDRDSTEIQELIEGVYFTPQNTDHVEAPWPWDGAPFEAQLMEQMVGSFTIVPEEIPFEESHVVTDIMDHQFYKGGDKIYHLLEDTLTTYIYSDGVLKYDSQLNVGEDCEQISADENGMLYLSQGIFEVIGVKDGAVVMQSNVRGDLTMHPSGKWGITSWVNNDTQYVTNKDGNLTAEPWILTNLNDDSQRQGRFKIIDNVAITDSHIMVAGTEASEDNNKKIAIYDYDGNELLFFGGEDIFEDEDCMGYVTGMLETENGFVAADGNMRRFFFWAKDGTFIGKIDTSDIFGTDYPWIEDMQLAEDGSIWVALTQEREDESADELLFFRLTGF